jgi:hypothetical protein
MRARGGFDTGIPGAPAHPRNSAIGGDPKRGQGKGGPSSQGGKPPPSSAPGGFPAERPPEFASAAGDPDMTELLVKLLGASRGRPSGTPGSSY